MAFRYSLTRAYKAEQFIIKRIDFCLDALFRGQTNLLRVIIFCTIHTSIRVFLFPASYLINYIDWESEIYDLKLRCLVVALHVNSAICRYLV